MTPRAAVSRPDDRTAVRPPAERNRRLASALASSECSRGPVTRLALNRACPPGRPDRAPSSYRRASRWLRSDSTSHPGLPSPDIAAKLLVLAGHPTGMRGDGLPGLRWDAVEACYRRLFVCRAVAAVGYQPRDARQDPQLAPAPPTSTPPPHECSALGGNGSAARFATCSTRTSPSTSRLVPMPGTPRRRARLFTRG